MAGSVYNGWEYPCVAAEPPNVRYLKIIMSPELNGYQNASVLFSHIPPGGSTGLHTHAASDEIMYIQGRGVSRIGDKTASLETDAVVFAPKGVEHECRNTSDTETLKLFCVYIPPLEPSPLLVQLIEKTKKYLTQK